MKVILIIAARIAALSLVGWLGLQIKPAPFQLHPEQPLELVIIPLPDGLPAQVERFYKMVYGEEIPVIQSAVIKGRAEISPFGFKLPARFLIVHKSVSFRNVRKSYIFRNEGPKQLST